MAVALFLCSHHSFPPLPTLLSPSPAVRKRVMGRSPFPLSARSSSSLAPGSACLSAAPAPCGAWRGGRDGGHTRPAVRGGRGEAAGRGVCLAAALVAVCRLRGGRGVNSFPALRRAQASPLEGSVCAAFGGRESAGGQKVTFCAAKGNLLRCVGVHIAPRKVTYGKM